MSEGAISNRQVHYQSHEPHPIKEDAGINRCRKGFFICSRASATRSSVSNLSHAFPRGRRSAEVVKLQPCFPHKMRRCVVTPFVSFH